MTIASLPRQAVDIRALDVVADGLSFPTSIALDAAGVPHVAESGLPFGGAPRGGRIWRLNPDSSRALLADGLRPPVNGLTFFEGAFYVSEGGHPGRISRLSPDGEINVLLDGLPGPGNYHTNMTVIGPDRHLYFSQGAMTNSGIIGLDAYELGWLRQLPHAHDLPGFDLVMAGINVETDDPLAKEVGARSRTGAFVPFGTPTSAGQRIEKALPCTAGAMRCRLDGTGLELVAWGLRNAFGLGFLPDGRLLALDQGADDRGSRPVGNAPDVLYEVRASRWYGWPDFVAGRPVTDPRFLPSRGPQPSFVLQNHAELLPLAEPLVEFAPHSAAVKFDAAPGGAFAGYLAVALFGDEQPMTAPEGPRQGRSIVMVDSRDWSTHEFITGVTRPIDVRFNGDGSVVYVLEFGEFEMRAHGMSAVPGSGALRRLRLS